MYRRTIGTVIWHSAPACSFWPKDNFEEKDNPTIGNRCAPCRTIESIPRLDGVAVLVVEDDQDSRELMKRVLESNGALVLTAGTGTEALRIVEKTPPDVLLSDIWMPEMDGYTLMEKIRRLKHEKPIPAVAVSAYTSVDARHKSSESGFQFHISKPIDLAEVLLKVAILAGRGGIKA